MLKSICAAGVRDPVCGCRAWLLRVICGERGVRWLTWWHLSKVSLWDISVAAQQLRTSDAQCAGNIKFSFVGLPQGRSPCCGVWYFLRAIASEEGVTGLILVGTRMSDLVRCMLNRDVGSRATSVGASPRTIQHKLSQRKRTTAVRVKKNPSRRHVWCKANEGAKGDHKKALDTHNGEKRDNLATRPMPRPHDQTSLSIMTRQTRSTQARSTFATMATKEFRMHLHQFLQSTFLQQLGLVLLRETTHLRFALDLAMNILFFFFAIKEQLQRISTNTVHCYSC